jgi:hypothetical protein
MKKKELIGKIIIEEDVDTIHENKIPRTFVIAVPDPLKSYYNWFTDINKPNSIIFITKKPSSFENILRMTKKINEKHKLNLDGAKCEVAIGSRKLHGIRVKGINRYHEIEEIQRHYLKQGTEFAKSEKLTKKNSLIRINKFFNIKRIGKGIYQSVSKDDDFYVEFPKHMQWDEFKRITFEIKNNIVDRNYDIAKGIFYIDGGITEMLRIIKPKASVKFLRDIQKRYIEKLK